MDKYGDDVLAGDWHRPARGRARECEATIDLVVEEVMTDFCGAIVRVDKDLHTVELEDRHGTHRVFELGPGFLVDGKPVILSAPGRRQAAGSKLTASGSVAVPATPARTAMPSRIYVEGRHDAELVEKVWGEDLRIEGVAVEYLGGIDDLISVVRGFGPAKGRRLGVLVDHLVPGSKESRIAAQVTGDHVLVAGHPYVDVWQAVKPQRLGLDAWPVVDRSVEWKHGICAELGWPHDDQGDIARAWKRILGSVRSYADLEAALLGRVEQLIDFVTA